MDLIVSAWQAHDGMHVYHYAPYEPSAFKRLMGRHATREQELDRLLRAGRFVDLYGVVRQGLRAGVERYSIKNLEPFYGFERDVPLRDASRALRAMEQALESCCPETVPPRSAGRRGALQPGRLRLDAAAARLARGAARGAGGVGRGACRGPSSSRGEASEAVDERAQRVEALRTRLLDGDPRGAARAQRGAAGALAARLPARLPPARGQGGLVGVLPAAELPEEDLFDEPRRAGRARVRRGASDVVTNDKTESRRGRSSTAIASRPRRWRSGGATS